MTTAPKIRRAVADDAAACARIVHGWVTATPWMPERFSEVELTGILADAIPQREVFVVGNPVQGYLSFHPETALIAGLYVEQRGAGLGKALIDHVKDGRDYLQLWTHAPNPKAHAFYVREGFEKTGETRDGDDGQAEFHMEWRR